MYILYIDDSGSIANPNEEYFVLGGVCVPERTISWLTGQLDSLAEILNGTIGDRPRFLSYLIRIRILLEKKNRGLSPIVPYQVI